MPLPKKPLSSVNRQPQGVPTGGQFAASAHSEPDVSLSAAEPFFTDADNDPDIMANAPAFDGDTGDEPANDLLGEGNGNGGQPPRNGGHGGSGGGDDAERAADINLMASAMESVIKRMRRDEIIAGGGGNFKVDAISVAARENGTLYFTDILDEDGNSLDKDGAFSDSLTFNVNANRIGGGIPAERILGDAKSALIDADALEQGEIRGL